jgi:hypothetical protein
MLVLLATAGVSACGGGGHKSGFSLSATRDCLDKAGFKTAVVRNKNFPSAVGNLRVKLDKGGQALLNPARPKGGIAPNQYVFLVFAEDPAGAVAIEKRAVRIAVQMLRVRGYVMTRAALESDVGLAKNVFYYSTTGRVTKADRAKFAPCLR